MTDTWTLPEDPFDITSWLGVIVEATFAAMPVLLLAQLRELVGLADYPASEQEFYSDDKPLRQERLAEVGPYEYLEYFADPAAPYTVDWSGPINRVGVKIKDRIYVSDLEEPAYTLDSLMRELEKQRWDRFNRMEWHTIFYGPDGMEDHIIRSEN